MRFLADESVYVAIVRALRDLGHDVVDLKEKKVYGVPDDEVFQLAVEQGRILVTMDLDFGNILLYPPGTHPGIIVLKLFELTVDGATNILRDFIQKTDESQIAKALVIVEPHRVRFRRGQRSETAENSG